MENCSFHGQLLSVMEVLAKAAEAEINRRVDDSCAVLRLEVRQSRQDIELLKKKCEVMEAELRRSRVRARRKAADRFSPLVRVVLNRGRRNSDWDRQTEPEGQSQAQQGADESNESVLIKEECPEEDAWKNDSEDKPSEQVTCFDASQPVQTDRLAERRPSAETACDPKPAPSPTHGYSAFPEQQLDGIQNEAELSVKHERQEELDENAAPLESAHGFGTEEGDGQMWSSSLCRDSVDPGFSYPGEQFEPVPSGFTSQSGLILGDMAPQIHLEGKSYSAGVGSVRVKKRGRAFGCRRTQSDGQNTLSQMNATDQCLITQQAQHQNTHSSPLMANPRVDLATPTTAAASFCRYSRSGFGLARRVRTPWRPSVGEKRFSCTYCDKNFMRFSQLKEHLRSHTGEKPFSCLLCGRSFTKQCNLIRHAVVHSGEKPHECSLCGKCFTQRSSLKSHQKTAH